MSVKVLFVCLGNICRSPTAHGLFRDLVKKAGLEKLITVDSAGTGGWHVGNEPDSRAQATAIARGYNIGDLSARQVHVSDFNTFDYILGMDQDNTINLKKMKPANYQGVVGLFLEEAGMGQTYEVPDPYYGDDSHFNHAIELIEQGSLALLKRIQREHGL